MNYIKKNLLILTFLGLSAGPILADDDFDFSPDLNEDEALAFIEEEPNALMTRSALPPTDALERLVDVFDGFDIKFLSLLEQPLFLRSHKPNTRSLLDSPLFTRFQFPCYDWVIGGSLFWNHTDGMIFGGSTSCQRDSTAISTYLNTRDANIIDQVNKVFDANSVSVDVNKFLPLVEVFSLQERKIGAMLHAMRNWECGWIELKTPFYYLERNFFLNPKQEEELKFALVGTGFLTPADFEGESGFADNHLVSDRLGFGDLRISGAWNMTETHNWCLTLGGFATLPTAFSLKRGLKGSHFAPAIKRPEFSFSDLACQVDNLPDPVAIETIQNQLQTFFLKALDNLSAMLLDQPLGNGRHPGLGLFLRPKSYLSTFIKRPWAECIVMKSRLSGEYLFPTKETRYFINQPDMDVSESNLLETTTDPALAKARLEKLEEIFVDKFFAHACPTVVHPGMVFRWTSSMGYEGDCWQFRLGTDTWARMKETIDTALSDKKNFDFEIARRPWAYQGSVWTSLSYRHSRDCDDWAFSLSGMKVFTSSNIGKHHNVSFNIERHF